MRQEGDDSLEFEYPPAAMARAKARVATNYQAMSMLDAKGTSVGEVSDGSESRMKCLL